MAWAVVERRTTATTRRLPPQRVQVRKSVWNVRRRSSAALSLLPDQPGPSPSMTERMFPAGSLNQAMVGPPPRKIPSASVRYGPSR